MPNAMPSQHPGPSDPVQPARRARYHHGDLSRALVEATLRLIEERGVEHVTLREVAKRVGVSPGAPFRHFAGKTALLTAVAEQAMARLRTEIDTALAETESRTDDPLARFRAFGVAYLRWARRNPTHFQIVSTRRLIDFGGSATLIRHNGEIRRKMRDLLQDALWRRLLREGTDIENVQLAGRALVYGLARMAIDGHFREWAPDDGPAEEAMSGALDLFIAGLAGKRAGEAVLRCQRRTREP
jgi:AcrR family transcriptional regulator